jgi:hypothetical protein
MTGRAEPLKTVTETAFDILDELYFVTPFSGLAAQLQLPEEELCKELQELIGKGYVKCFFPDPDTEISPKASGFLADCRKYFYLATKAGLLAHNSR